MEKYQINQRPTENYVVERQRKEVLEQGLGSLVPRHRGKDESDEDWRRRVWRGRLRQDLIPLVFGEGLSVREAADKLGVNTGSVGIELERALQLLRALLTNDNFYGGEGRGWLEIEE